MNTKRYKSLIYRNMEVSMKLEGQSKNHLGMRSADKLMRDHFKDTINLVNYWGPVQMCVFYLEYMYLPSKYN